MCTIIKLTRKFLFSYQKNVLKKTREKIRLTQGLSFRTICHTAQRANSNQIGALIEKWTLTFRQNGISEPHESIKYILEHVLNTRAVEKQSKNVVDQVQIGKIEKLCKERLKRKPIQYIIGEWDFRQLNLKMSPPVFIPRPETEGLVDLVLAEIDCTTTHQQILELCCGSGAISLSILNERHPIRAVAVDQSAPACQLTKENAQKHSLDNRLTIIQAEIERYVGQQCHIIVSNPPYIPSNELDQLQPEIRLYEDLRALDGKDNDGLGIIKSILAISSRLLTFQGKLFLELDPRQPQLIHNYLDNNKCLHLVLQDTVRDFCNKERYCIIRKTNKTG